MKLIERIVKEYTQPLNEARARKWTDADKFWSKNICMLFLSNFLFFFIIIG